MESPSGCYCMGVVNHHNRSEPEYSKRLCIVGTDEDCADVQLDFADKELFVLQSVIAGGFLEIVQQAARITAQ